MYVRDRECVKKSGVEELELNKAGYVGLKKAFGVLEFLFVSSVISCAPSGASVFRTAPIVAVSVECEARNEFHCQGRL